MPVRDLTGIKTSLRNSAEDVVSQLEGHSRRKEAKDGRGATI